MIKTVKKMKMTKKIKISISIILITTLLLGSVLALFLIKKSYYPPVIAPDRIVVYYNSDSNNILFEKNDENYNKIYNQLIKSFKQSMLISLFSGSINNNPKIIEHDNSKIKYDGIKINFMYDKPQVVKLNNNLYLHNNETYWYQNLVFTISSIDKYQYSEVAIIPPENSNNYISYDTYILSYQGYSNFYKLHKICTNLFE